MSQLRTRFYDGDEFIASVWVAVGAKASPASRPAAPNFGQRIEGPPAAPKIALPDGTVFLSLLHDYPDLKPQVGWRVEGRGLAATIATVDGLNLTCRENK